MVMGEYDEARNNSPSETEPATIAQEKWQCPNCETINTGSVCSVCGSQHNVPLPPPMPVKKPSRVLYIVLALIAVVEAIIVLINFPLIRNERIYKMACVAIESKNYAIASDYICELNSDGASQYYAALLRFAEKIVKNGKSEELSEYYAVLKEMDEADAQMLAARYEKELYDAAVGKYRRGDYLNSKTVFEAIPEYERSTDYLLLIEMQTYKKSGRLWWSDGYSNADAKKCSEKLLDILDFEDSGELLLSSTDSALLFLEGGWSNGAGTWISFSYAEEAADYDFLASWSIKGVPNGSWRFQDGEFLLTDAGGIESCKANFAVVDKNTITITTEVTGDTYTLKRK